MRDTFMAVCLIVGVIGTIVLGIYGAIRYHEYRKRCTDNGGHWEKYNCHQVSDWNCDYYMDMNGNIQLMGCHTDYSTRCDKHCVGATPEAQP